jgi:hypothetical protein
MSEYTRVEKPFLEKRQQIYLQVNDNKKAICIDKRRLMGNY